MFRDYSIKNPTLRKVVKDKFIVRLQADATIPANRLVERDASTGDIELAGADSLRVIGANQDSARADGDYFNCEIGPVYVTAGVEVVAGQRVKAGADGKLALFVNATDTLDLLVGYVLVGADADADATVNIL